VRCGRSQTQMPGNVCSEQVPVAHKSQAHGSAGPHKAPLRSSIVNAKSVRPARALSLRGVRASAARERRRTARRPTALRRRLRPRPGSACSASARVRAALGGPACSVQGGRPCALLPSAKHCLLVLFALQCSGAVLQGQPQLSSVPRSPAEPNLGIPASPWVQGALVHQTSATSRQRSVGDSTGLSDLSAQARTGTSQAARHARWRTRLRSPRRSALSRACTRAG